jgi:hypothetical protein
LPGVKGGNSVCQLFEGLFGMIVMFLDLGMVAQYEKHIRIIKLYTSKKIKEKIVLD